MLNIVESCFAASPEKIAIYQAVGKSIEPITYGTLKDITNQVAGSLIQHHFKPGDAIAIDLPMTWQQSLFILGSLKWAVLLYQLQICFSSAEIAARLRISQAKAIFTQDNFYPSGKVIGLYNKVIDANAPPAIVLASNKNSLPVLRAADLLWEDFLTPCKEVPTYFCSPMTHCQYFIFFRTTGDPKAIPWNHTTAIKAAADAFLYQDIHTDDILAWPTNLGWMMGPWLIFAAFINQAGMALFDDVPSSRAFGEFIQTRQSHNVGCSTHFSAAWRKSNCMQGLDWQHIKCFSSTGECSNAEDMLYLMSLAGYKPVIEYCGGTEIGGAYITKHID